ncbi:MAG: hypothetical protein AAF882_05120 [Pseudomonadota bacterium]
MQEPEHTAERAIAGLVATSTILTARSRTSGENMFVVLLIGLNPTQELEPPTHPARFTCLAPITFAQPWTTLISAV